jgi:hypothetical protein
MTPRINSMIGSRHVRTRMGHRYCIHISQVRLPVVGKEGIRQDSDVLVRAVEYGNRFAIGYCAYRGRAYLVQEACVFVFCVIENDEI